MKLCSDADLSSEKLIKETEKLQKSVNDLADAKTELTK